MAERNLKVRNTNHLAKYPHKKGTIEVIEDTESEEGSEADANPRGQPLWGS